MFWQKRGKVSRRSRRFFTRNTELYPLCDSCYRIQSTTTPIETQIPDSVVGPRNKWDGKSLLLKNISKSFHSSPASGVPRRENPRKPTKNVPKWYINLDVLEHIGQGTFLYKVSWLDYQSSRMGLFFYHQICPEQSF